MVEGVSKGVRKYYNKFIHTIAFIPGIMGLCFLLLAIFAMKVDKGVKLNEQFDWLSLQDAETARTIVATVAAGIISLTVFSFSMVMVVINQAASQMSNRMLDNIIGDKVQKIVLGFYIGTIVFAFFLLTNIKKTDNVNSVPSLTVHFLLVLTVFDIFLFVYFLNYISQSFRYELLIKRIHNRTAKTLNTLYVNNKATFGNGETIEGKEILSGRSGYYQGFDEKQLVKLAEKHELVIQMLHPIGTYILEDMPLLIIKGNIDKKDLKRLLLDMDFYYGQEIDKNAYYGFFHLTEIAVKALSPGINDPGTAVLSVDALTNLFAKIMKRPIADVIKNADGKTLIITKQIQFDELFERTVLPIWNYGRKDMNVLNALNRMLNHLILVDKENEHKKVFSKLLYDVKSSAIN